MVDMIIKSEQFQLELSRELEKANIPAQPIEYAIRSLVYSDSLQKLIHYFDRTTQIHQENLSVAVGYIGLELGLSFFDSFGLLVGARMHDVGKIGVSRNILQKPSALTADEYNSIKLHTTIGRDIVKLVNTVWKLEDLCLSHHERLDGSGYPNQLVGAEISLPLRIIQACDVYDAVTQDRPYSDKRTHIEAMTFLEDTSKFDEDVVASINKIPNFIKKYNI